MCDFPLQELLDEELCQSWLLKKLHPEGLCCPEGHLLPIDQAPHRFNRQGIPSFRCRECGKVFNLFTGTIFSKSRQPASILVLFLRGVSQGQTSAQLSRELDWDYETVLNLRHRAQALLEEGFPPSGLPDAVVEADEMFQNAGEKGVPHLDPKDPPRKRANHQRGRGTYENDRPPLFGITGRESGTVRMWQVDHCDKQSLQPLVEDCSEEGAEVHTDELNGYDGLDQRGRIHRRVCHGQKEYARDEDGDGFCSVHCNTIEGIWVGLRNFLRNFRGVSKGYLNPYVAVFMWTYNLKQVCSDLIVRMTRFHL
jgi:transposase-like protein